MSLCPWSKDWRKSRKHYFLPHGSLMTSAFYNINKRVPIEPMPSDTYVQQLDGRRLASGHPCALVRIIFL
jgi:hypothetical protein